MFKDNDDRSGAGAPDRGGIWSLAALSVAALCCSVLGARMLSEIIGPSDPRAIVESRSELNLRQLAASVPRPSARETVTVVRSLGVDGMTTATVPSRVAAPIAPCGDKGK